MKLTILKFIKDRFHPKASILISIVLFSAPFLTITQNRMNYFIGLAATFSIFLALRMADDLTSIREDTIHHPQRGLVSGKINIKELWWSLSFLITLIFSITLLTRQTGLLIFVFIYYSLFFLIKESIPLLLRPFFTNLIFLIIPSFATNTILFNSITLFLGLFLWTGAIAHEYSHNIHGPEENLNDSQSYANLIGPLKTAYLSLGLFFCSFICAILFWYESGKPFLFVCVLILASIQMFFLYYRLIKKPCEHNSRPFYIFGFTFFLIPCVAYIIDSFY